MSHWQVNADAAWLKLDPKQVLSREQVDAATKSWFVPSHWSIAAAYCKPDMAALTAEVNPYSERNKNKNRPVW